MINKFDRKLINNFKTKDLEKICNANIKLVTENIISAVKYALCLEPLPIVQSLCNHFLGWNLEKVAYLNGQGHILDVMFEAMKCRFQPSCETVCIDPKSHFQEFSSENKCYPIGEVFQVLSEISQNAANKLLDEKLVYDVFRQIKMKETKEKLKIYSVNSLSQKKWLNRKVFKVLLINMDLLIVENSRRNFDVAQSTVKESEKYDNLIENLNNNFPPVLLSKPTSENASSWEENVDKLHNQTNVIVLLFSSNILDAINRYNTKQIGNQFNSINSNVLPNHFLNVEDDPSMKYVYSVWKKIRSSNKLKICVSFEPDLMKSIYKIFPMAFYLPDEMLKMLVLIKAMEKQ